MVSVRDVNTDALIRQTAFELKARMKMPDWARFAKTGVSRERPPENEDWWYIRAASILRKIDFRGPVGTQNLRSYYGGLHRRGHKPAHFARGSGKVIRVILQDLEKAGYIKKEKKGRVITPDGRKFLNRVAKNVK